MEILEGGVTSPCGFKAAGVTAGLKRSGAPDMAMIYSELPCKVAAAFTSNLFAAAPVEYDRDMLAKGGVFHAVVVNSGNANACTGAAGLADSAATAAEAAKLLGIAQDQVLVSSTGRIGVPMPMDIILGGVRKAVPALSEDGGAAAAQAIMTTDTRPKSFKVEITVGGKKVTVGGMTKGAGMIAPKMRPARPPQATMLSYLTTDANIEKKALQQALEQALDLSYNRITVDGDTSTNDTFMLIANGAAGNPEIKAGSAEAAQFTEAVAALAGRLAREMVLDGEGVSRFVEVNVTGAPSDRDARTVAEAIANSALCKTAWFGGDPNWGRIVCAAGYSGVQFDPKKVNLDLAGMPAVRNGMDAGVPESELAKAVSVREFSIDLDLGCGNGKFTVWTCDLTHRYVEINADMHT